MKNFKTFLLILIFSACTPSNDDCTKTIQIPQIYVINNQSFYYDISQEVACDFPEPQNAIMIEPPVFENFTYEVLSFIYTPDTGNNTSRLQFEIKLINNSSNSVTGFPMFTLQSDAIQFSTNYSDYISPPCNTLAANSSCTVTLDLEESRDIGFANTVELLNVEYYLTN